MEKVRAHLFIEGTVQGVFFRHNTQRKAFEFGVKGWVRNLWDGRVEAVFEGERDKVNQIVAWCYRGPSGASVEKVDLAWEEYQEEFDDFKIAY